MRITGGKLVGRAIEPPTSRVTRPMMDRTRQALFNILAHHDWGRDIGKVLDGGHVLDAFCGTGALGFEALSWGMEHATMFDQDAQALAVARKNAAALGLGGKANIVAANTLQPPKASAPCRLIFLAPPYRKNLIPPAMLALDRAGWMAKHVLILAETAKREELELPEGFAELFARYYADTALRFIVRGQGRGT
jgi:16S rRNA (guanine966-N2)-methyltransferase